MSGNFHATAPVLDNQHLPEFEDASADFAPVILKKLEVMFAPIAKGRGDNLSSFGVSDQLRFLGVSPFLPL